VRAPDYVEPHVGWRVWDVVETNAGARLSSLVYNELWPVRLELVASCRLDESFPPPDQRVWDEHPVPHTRCSCGIHASRSVDLVRPYLVEHGRGGRSVLRVAGLVAIWGEIVEGAHGWRASHAYPVRLYLPQRVGHALALELADYGVPIDLLDSDRPDAYGALAAA
jgi:hypothetical protein